ncbi:MAG: trimeric autotransporter adhesin [Sphingomonadales bacterium]|nr:trimeric autotransporter adhesin [Sphingomonadales bacterium]
MRLFTPSEGPVWLRRFADSILAAFKQVMDAPFRLWPSATADLPAAADHGGGLAWNATVSRIAYSDGGAWQEVQPYDPTLAALAAYNANGLVAQTAPDAFAARTILGPAAGLTIANGNGVAGNPTLGLANDLAALEGLSGTSTIYYRSGADAWSAVTIGGNLGFAGGTLGSALGNAATKTIGTSGAAVPLLNGGNIHSGANIFSGPLRHASAAEAARFEGVATQAPTGSTGLGVEIVQQGGVCYVLSYNRTTNAFGPLSVDGASVSFRTNGTQTASFTSTAASFATGASFGGGISTTSASVQAGYQQTGHANPTVSLIPTGWGSTATDGFNMLGGVNAANNASGDYGLLYVKSGKTIGLMAGSSLVAEFSGSQARLNQVAVATGGSLYSCSVNRAGQCGYHLYNGGAIQEWLVYQPAHASGDDFRIATLNSGFVTDRLTVSTVGAVSIGNSLTVANNVRATDATFLQSGQGNISISHSAASGTPTTSILAASACNLSLGANGGSMLDITSSGVAIVSGTTASAANVFQSASGAQLLRSTSSMRFKQDARPLGEEEAERLLRLEPFTYRSKCAADDRRRRHWGVSAEQALAVGLGKLVHREPDGMPAGFMYERAVAGLIAIARSERAARRALEARMAAAERALGLRGTPAAIRGARRSKLITDQE